MIIIGAKYRVDIYMGGGYFLELYRSSYKRALMCADMCTWGAEYVKVVNLENNVVEKLLLDGEHVTKEEMEAANGK